MLIISCHFQSTYFDGYNNSFGMISADNSQAIQTKLHHIS